MFWVTYRWWNSFFFTSYNIKFLLQIFSRRKKCDYKTKNEENIKWIISERSRNYNLRITVPLKTKYFIVLRCFSKKLKTIFLSRESEVSVQMRTLIEFYWLLFLNEFIFICNILKFVFYLICKENKIFSRYKHFELYL